MECVVLAAEKRIASPLTGICIAFSSQNRVYVRKHHVGGSCYLLKGKRLMLHKLECGNFFREPSRAVFRKWWTLMSILVVQWVVSLMMLSVSWACSHNCAMSGLIQEYIQKIDGLLKYRCSHTCWACSPWDSGACCLCLVQYDHLIEATFFFNWRVLV